MRVEIVSNGEMTMVIVPENEMEEMQLKQLLKQDNQIVEARSNVVILNKTYPNSLVIGKKSTSEQDAG